MRIEIADVKYSGQIADIYAPFVRSTSVSFETEAPDGAAMAKRIENIKEKYPFIVCRDSKRITGYAYAAPFGERSGFDWTVFSSIYVHPGYQRKGIGEALYISLLEILRTQGFVNVYAAVALPNDPSCALHSKVGFRQQCVLKNVGFKLGRWHDLAYFHVGLNDDEISPQKTVDFKELDPLLVQKALKLGEQMLCR